VIHLQGNVPVKYKHSSGKKTLAILQSCYIPWKGYFDLMNLVDEFVLFDDRQYTKRDWRNRNLIKKIGGGLQWVSIPVEVKGKFDQRICDTKISDPTWAKTHWRTIQSVYGKAPGFSVLKELLADWYDSTTEVFLSQVNYQLLSRIHEFLCIDTKLSWSMDYQAQEGQNERLISICQQAGAERYVSGPAARDYIDENLFKAAGIELVFMDYSGYRAYEQVLPPFEHGVSIVDLIACVGNDARSYLKA
jgi:hypothetical protein